MKLKLDLHAIYSDGKKLDQALDGVMREAMRKRAKTVEIIPGKGSGQLKKYVLRTLEKKYKTMFHRIEKDSKNFGRIFVHFRHLGVVLACSVVLGGCASSGTLRRLKTLQAVAREQEAMTAEVDQRDAAFDRLWEAVNAEELEPGMSAEWVKQAFGPPVLIKRVVYQGQRCQRWLYRYATRYFPERKVYLYFDERQRLLAWDWQAKTVSEGTRINF